MKKVKEAFKKAWEWMFDKAAYVIATMLLIAFVLAPTALVIWLVQLILEMLGVI